MHKPWNVPILEPREFKLSATRSKRYLKTFNPSDSVRHFPRLLARHSICASRQIADVALYTDGNSDVKAGYRDRTFVMLANGKFKLLLNLWS